MSAFLKAVVLAVIQGLTEFLPVSSSGHLVLAKHLLGLQSPGVVLEVGLHAGTLISVLIYYRSRIFQLARQVVKGEGDGRYYFIAIVISSLPCGVVYLLLGEEIEALFDAPATAAVMLCITGLFLCSLTSYRHDMMMLSPVSNRLLSVGKGFWIGVAQAFAMAPGISRSGATITLGRHLGLSSKTAAEFSLLMSVPVVLGAVLIKTASVGGMELGDVTVISLVAGSLVSACVGYISIVCLVRTLSSGKFWLFGFYCLAVGVVGMMVLL